MAQAQKTDFVFRRKGRVHLNRRWRQFSRLLATEVCASAVVMLDTPCSEVVPTPFASFPFTSPPVRHRVPSRFSWTLTRGQSWTAANVWNHNTLTDILRLKKHAGRLVYFTHTSSCS